MLICCMVPLVAIGLTFNEGMLTVGVAGAAVAAVALLIRMALLERTGVKSESGVCRYVDGVMGMAYPLVIAYLILHEWGLTSDPFLWLAGGLCVLLFLKEDMPF